MKTDHAHVEAAVLALGVLVALGVLDLLVSLWDGEPRKQLGYLGVFVVAYVVAYVFRKRAWGR